MIKLSTVLGPYGYARQLRSGRYDSSRLTLEHQDIRPISSAFPRVVAPEMEFDVAELALVTYGIARAFGRRITAIPVFLLGGFPHDCMVYRHASGIRRPEDLRGRRVAMPALSQTTGVWLRSILEQEHGIGFDEVRWIATRGEHVAEFQPPPGVELRMGADPRELLERGEVDACIAAVPQRESPGIRMLFEADAPARWYRKHRYYPINHTIVVRNELLEQQPWLASELVQMFESARRDYLARLGEGSARDEIEERLLSDHGLVGDQLLASGLVNNSSAIEALFSSMVRQKILSEPLDPNSLF